MSRTNRAAEPNSWLRSTLIFLLSIIFSGIVFLQLSSPASLLSAILRQETRNLDWNPIHRRYVDLLQQDDKRLNRHAISQLMSRLINARRSRGTLKEAVTAGQADLQRDPDNLVSRLVYAAIVDAVEYQNPSQDPLARFNRIRSIVDQPAPASVVTLYNDRLFSWWQQSVEGHIRRPDVAAALRQFPPPVQFPNYVATPIDQHDSALPICQETLDRLSVSLLEAHHDRQAAECQRWIARCMVGLIQSESVTATRLLCADILARCLEPSSAEAAELQALRRDYQDALRQAPRDLGDQSGDSFGRPALDPKEYRMAFDSLIVTLIFAFSSVATGALWVLLSLARVLLLALKRRPTQRMNQKSLPALMRVAMAAVPQAVATVLLVSTIRTHGVHSITWIYLIGLTLLSLGPLGSLACAGFAAHRSGHRTVYRQAIVYLFVLILLAILALPPVVAARLCRPIDLWIGTTMAFPILAVLFVLLSVGICPSSLRTMARTAALGWCVNIAMAVAVLQFHRGADLRHQQATVAGRTDELTARLGADWQNTYLAAACRKLGIETP